MHAFFWVGVMSVFDVSGSLTMVRLANLSNGDDPHFFSHSIRLCYGIMVYEGACECNSADV